MGYAYKQAGTRLCKMHIFGVLTTQKRKGSLWLMKTGLASILVDPNLFSGYPKILENILSGSIFNKIVIFFCMRAPNENINNCFIAI